LPRQGNPEWTEGHPMRLLRALYHLPRLRLARLRFQV
jgi:hypothetical protein